MKFPRVLFALFLISSPGCFSARMQAGAQAADKEFNDYAPEVAKKRAAFDLDCGASQLSAVNVGQGTWGVRGCGKKAVYAVRCQADAWNGTIYRESCSAILNSAVSPDSASDGVATPIGAPAVLSESL